MHIFSAPCLLVNLHSNPLYSEVLQALQLSNQSYYLIPLMRQHSTKPLPSAARSEGGCSSVIFPIDTPKKQKKPFPPPSPHSSPHSCPPQNQSSLEKFLSFLLLLPKSIFPRKVSFFPPSPTNLTGGGLATKYQQDCSFNTHPYM